jgi:hypothetical protein
VLDLAVTVSTDDITFRNLGPKSGFFISVADHTGDFVSFRLGVSVMEVKADRVGLSTTDAAVFFDL